MPDGDNPSRNHYDTNVPRRSFSRLTRSAGPLWYAVIVLFFIFALEEVANRTWLIGVDKQVLRHFHLGMVFFSFLIAGAAVSWCMLRASPVFLATLTQDGEGLIQPRLDEAERIKTYTQWFIAMRWMAVLVITLLVVITVKIGHWLQPDVWWPLILTTGALAGLNLLYTWLLQVNRYVALILVLQGYIDVVVLAVLLQFSGGAENPLSNIMVFHVIIAGVLLSRRQCYGIATVGTLLYGLVIWAEWAGVWIHHSLDIVPQVELVDEAYQGFYVLCSGMLQAVILFLTAYFVTSLAERLHRNEQRLETMANRALAERQLLERALDTTATGLRVLNLDLLPYWSSKHWRDWFGLQDGSRCDACTSSTGPDCAARRSAQDGQVRLTELVLQSDPLLPASDSRCDSQRIFEITTAPLLDGQGKISQIVELAQDVTLRKRNQAEMIKAGKLAIIGELAGQVAHEVNNPIAIITAKTSLLLSDHRTGMSLKVAQDLEKINHLANRVARVAQGLLSYCRPSGAARIELDIRVPVRKSLAMIESKAHEVGVRIEDLMASSLPPVRANMNELEQVFLNLFLNALDAMPHGGHLKITAANSVWLSSGVSGLAVQVVDTGSGIPAAIQERIFEPFFTTKKDGKGTGLGLSICLGLVRSHGGELEVASKTGEGTSFTVKLPICASTGSSANEHHG